MLPSLRPAINPKRPPAVITISSDIEKRLQELNRITENERQLLRKRYDDVVMSKRVPDRYFNTSYFAAVSRRRPDGGGGSHLKIKSASNSSPLSSSQVEEEEGNEPPSTSSLRTKANTIGEGIEDGGGGGGEGKGNISSSTSSKAVSSGNNNNSHSTTNKNNISNSQQRIVQGDDRRATEPKKTHAIIKKLKLPKGVTDRSGLLLAATARVRVDTSCPSGGVASSVYTTYTPRKPEQQSSSSLGGRSGGRVHHHASSSSPPQRFTGGISGNKGKV